MIDYSFWASVKMSFLFQERERQKLLAALAKKPSGGAIAAVTAAASAMQQSAASKASNTALGIAAVAMTSSLATAKPAPSVESKPKSSASESSKQVLCFFVAVKM